MASHPESQTVEVDNAYFETVIYYNRHFQQYAITNLSYFQPVDEDELERLRVWHAVLNRVFDNRLLFPTLGRPRRILDCGYGTASWAIDVATQNPGCEVIAIDIYPYQPETVPENLYLQVDDLNNRFTFQAHNFDLVHSRLMTGAIHVNRWAGYLRDMLRVLRPGGWAQLVELYHNVQSDNGSLTDAHALRQWSTRYIESLNGVKDLRVPPRLPDMMRAAGFVDIEHRMIPLHTCGWSSDPREYEIGTANRANVQQFLSSIALYPFAERLEMPIQDVQLLVAQARVEADDPLLKAYFPLYVCIGRKPRLRR
ncbi:70350c73-62cb-43f3-a5b4-2e597e81abd5 [Sclerotinia trifoliorum]|uniref:70350c73-62cb-43f3-a5b4-2e597e81abd5 n=1 Tax=Sclerotinia trifoliorum TaxID=28548 RepID=A0A8H2ZS23_9HELO|nr:70350c73-62cb-43f3-a5b4-2e597e81abd5 [Sclerotinia trifoliorum]